MDTGVESTIEEAFAKCAEGDAATVGVTMEPCMQPSFAPICLRLSPAHAA